MLRAREDQRPKEKEQEVPVEWISKLAQWGAKPWSQALVGILLLVGVLVSMYYVMFEGMFAAEDGMVGTVMFYFVLAFVCGLSVPAIFRLLSNASEGSSAEHGVAEASDEPVVIVEQEFASNAVDGHAERQLLEAIERRGEISPVRAALETSLTVDEADRRLSDLAQRGYLDVRVDGGKLLYSL